MMDVSAAPRSVVSRRERMQLRATVDVYYGSVDLASIHTFAALWVWGRITGVCGE